MLRLRIATLTIGLAVGLSAAPAAQAASTTVKVMTRNLYLGADLTPGLEAKNIQGLVNGAGVILNQVDANNFAIRAKGLAREILGKKPDLVGLQEAALWRTQTCDKNPIPPSATTVRYDYIQLLLSELNRGSKRYRLVIAKPEFDFEVWANTDGDEKTAGPNCPMGSEINGRLTMRDAILARVGTVSTSKSLSGTFDTLLQVKPANVTVDVTRGWTATDVRKSGHRFRFVNAHLEAFDNQKANHTNKDTTVGNGEIRQQQARELVNAVRSAYATPRPIIALGDFNSDVRTEVKPGDSLAYRVLLGEGFRERAKASPFSCCIGPSTLTTAAGGKVTDFNHTVDHVMTNAPRKITLISSAVTGRSPLNGFWDSDHAGVFSSLKVR